jgi:hypothetical protein
VAMNARTSQATPETAAPPGVGLILFVGLQLFVATQLGSGYITALTILHDDPKGLVSYFHLYPTYAAMGVVSLVSGLFITAIAGVGMLMRQAWAPFLFVAWLVIALSTNIVHPHNLDLLRLPYVLYPAIVAAVYVSMALRSDSQFRDCETQPNQVRLWLRRIAVIGLLLLSFVSPGNFPLAVATWTYGCLRGDKPGMALTLVSTLSLAIAAVGFAELAHEAFPPNAPA